MYYFDFDISDYTNYFLRVFIHDLECICVIWGVCKCIYILYLFLIRLLFGERPFWWIGESRLFVNKQPKIHQFPSTCETGPGSPSGHAMVTAAVWWVIVSSLGSFLYSLCCFGSKNAQNSAPYVLYVVMLVAVGISRIFILAHFPHQVVAGSITGLNTYYAKIIFLKKAGHFIKTLMLHAGLKQLGIDLSWSIALAKKWCSHAEWIRLDTAPFSSLTRDCGALLGLGLAQYWKPGGWSLPWAPRALSMAVSSMGLYHVNRLPLPVRPLGLFYSLFFVKFVLVPLIVMVLICCSSAFSLNSFGLPIEQNML
uniref:Glucose-6-phosphatase 3 n=1 Tax=Pundamilia nyererei TaxID=303518 RepID=A0A3B4HCZ2_9CICH